MASENSELWSRARRARDELAGQFLNHPDVSLIGIGYDQDPEGQELTGRIVVRVHVRRPLTMESLGLPDEINGIPIRVVVSDFKLE